MPQAVQLIFDGPFFLKKLGRLDLAVRPPPLAGIVHVVYQFTARRNYEGTGGYPS